VGIQNPKEWGLTQALVRLATQDIEPVEREMGQRRHGRHAAEDAEGFSSLHGLGLRGELPC
jgi:hypothetical protein